MEFRQSHSSGTYATSVEMPSQARFRYARLNAYLGNESGATAIEYGLIAAGIALVIVTAVALVGSSLTSTFNAAANLF